MHTFSQVYWKTIVNPSQAFGELLTDRRMLQYSIGAVLIMAVLYTFVYLFLIYGGGQPFKPWLDIPLDRYYRYNVFFCAPSMFLGWILAAGVVQLVSRFMHGKGTFEQTLGVMGFGIGVASWATGIHDLLTSFLGAVHVIDQHAYEAALNSPTLWRSLLWIQMLVYLVWFVVLFTKGLQTTHHISIGQAVMLAIPGFLVYQLFFLIFNR